jgi:Flp pilus assembly protein TadD
MLLVVLLLLQSDGPARQAAEVSERAYASLRVGDYDQAIAGFTRALQLRPGLAHVRKDLAYTLLRRGDREEARDHFEQVVTADPSDEQAALEYAFLCHETRRSQTARRVFGRLKDSRDPRVRSTAATAFENIDLPLREGLARWREAVARAPRQWSAHEELARLAETRDELDLAAEHYEIAWRLRPSEQALLLDLARVLDALGQSDRARSALVSAWRSPRPRVSEEARERLHGEIPASTEVALALPAEPLKLAAGRPAKELGMLSLEQNALVDALRYLTRAYQENPSDAEVLYELGVTSNLLKLDRDALRWFDRASAAPDPLISVRARNAYETLSPLTRRPHTTAWTIPIFSSRWRDAFLYGQARTEWQPRRLPFTTYLSVRFIGDVRGGQAARMYRNPLFLSERAAILGAGISRQINYNLLAWAEAGQYFTYADVSHGGARSRPDYRGGLAWLKGWGHLLGSTTPGRFFEQNIDGVYSSRFGNDLLLYVQNRVGWTLPRSAGGWQAQFYSTFNLVGDRRGEYWGNLAEAGVGGRYLAPRLPRGMSFRTEFVRGAHLNNNGNPWRPNYWDARIGMWYGFAR